MKAFIKCSYVLLLTVFSMSALPAQLVQDNVVLLSRRGNGQQNQNFDHQQKSLALLSIFPNPAMDYVTIKIPLNNSNDEKSTLVQVCDNKGVVLIQQEKVTDYSTLDVSALTSGVYYLRIVTAQSVVTKQFTKQ